MNLTLPDRPADAPAPYSNPTLNALCDLIDASGTVRMAIYHGKNNGASAFHLADLQRALAALDRAKQHLRGELKVAPYVPLEEPDARP